MIKATSYKEIHFYNFGILQDCYKNNWQKVIIQVWIHIQEF